MTLLAALMVTAAVLAGRTGSRARLRRRRRAPASGDAGRTASRVRSRRAWGDQGRTDAALAVDLLAACLAVGATTPAALRAAAAAAPRAAGALAAVSAALEEGMAPATAWARVSGDALLTEVGRTCARGGASGAAVADELRRLAGRARAHRRTTAQRRVQRASVWVVVPLGLCFLPAFLLVGVVPLIAAGLPQLTG